MNNIFQTLVYQREKKRDTVLATIIWDDGSAPRGRGSQMLVGAEGLLAGTCLLYTSPSPRDRG